jgi:RNA polymerase sigma-70 factor, ECF subfamily
VPANDAGVALAVDVRRALAELPESDRRLLLARYWADLTQHEAATLLGMPDGTAKVRLHRLRARLRPTLREPQ